MKKIFLIAFTFIGITAFAQEKSKVEGAIASPAQVESDNAAKAKINEAEKMKMEEKAKMERYERAENKERIQEMEKKESAEKVNKKYQEAGLSTAQIIELNQIDKKITENNNNTTLSTDEKAKMNQELETEKKRLQVKYGINNNTMVPE